MDCTNVQQLLDEYLEGALDERERKLVEEHLASCGDCTRSMAFLRAYRREMRNLRAVRAPADFLRNVHSRMRERRPFRDLLVRLFSPSGLKLPLELAGVTAVALAALVLFGVVGGGRDRGALTQSRWRTGEISRAERAAGRKEDRDLPPEVIAMDLEEESTEGSLAVEAMPGEELSGDEIPRDVVPEILGKAESPRDAPREEPRPRAPAGGRLPEAYPREPAPPAGAAAEAGEEKLPLREDTEEVPAGPGEPSPAEEGPGMELTVLMPQEEPPEGSGEQAPAGEEHVLEVVRAIEALGGKIVFKEYRGSSGGPAVINAVIPGSGYRMLIHELERLGRVVGPDGAGAAPEGEDLPGPQEELQVRIRFMSGAATGTE